MSYFIDLPRFQDERGILTLIEDGKSFLPFEVARIFCIHNLRDLPRGGHKHHKTIEAVFMVKGSCTITTYEKVGEETSFHLNNSKQCLILPAEEWRVLHNFSEDAFLLVLASEKYSYEDYIFNDQDLVNDTL